MTETPGDGLPAATNSPLGSLRGRRKAIIELLYEDTPVPRWTDPEIFVRYHPVALEEVEKAAARMRELQASQRQTNRAGRRSLGKAPVALLDINIDLLLKADPGVFIRKDEICYTLTDIDTWQPVECDDDGWPTPEAKLCPLAAVDILGPTLSDEELPTTRALVKALYLVDGDILKVSDSVAKLSGYSEDEADEAILGE